MPDSPATRPGPPHTPHPKDHTPGPALLDVKMHLHTPASPCTGTVVSNERCTQRKSAHFVRHIAIDIAGTALAGNFRPGQSFGVLPPGLDAHGRPHKLRLYSTSSPTRGEDGAGNIVATTVKRTIDEHWETHGLFLGVASNYLCDLKPGDTVQLTGPSGKRFVLPARPEEHDYLFFATGTGIAPFRGMLMDLLGEGPIADVGSRIADGKNSSPPPPPPPPPPAPSPHPQSDIRNPTSAIRHPQSRITLIMGAAYATDLLYHGDFLKLQQQHPDRFTYLTAISRERQDDGHDPCYVQDRLTSHADHLLPLLESDRTLIYVCGLAGMELGIFQKLAGLLPNHALEHYLRVEPECLSNIIAWQRSMIQREIRLTRRVFLEVY